MSQDDCGNSSTISLLGSNNQSRDKNTTPEAFSRHVLTHIKALREALAGKGDEYTLIANLITLKSGKPLCMEML